MRDDNGFDVSMRWYLGAVLLFGSVVLWASKATWPIWALLFGAGVVLLSLPVGAERRAPRVVVVGGMSDKPATELLEALTDAGFDLCGCAGPAVRPCPFETGRLCPLGDHLSAAVIIRHADETGPLAPCTRALFVPSLAVEENTDQRPELAGPYARVGWKRGPKEVVHTLEDLLRAA